MYKFSLILILLSMANFLNAKNRNETKADKSTSQPNVIFFSVDDMNDWIGPLGYDQVKTPNMDRLAESGVNFTNTHAPGVYCAPSRTAIWTGMQASTTGCYENEIYHYDFPELVPLQMAFKQGGYNTYGAGKLFHHRGGYVDLRAWNEFFSRSQEMRDMGCVLLIFQKVFPIGIPAGLFRFLASKNEKPLWLEE
jgi:hypothetical protein